MDSLERFKKCLFDETVNCSACLMNVDVMREKQAMIRNLSRQERTASSVLMEMLGVMLRDRLANRYMEYFMVIHPEGNTDDTPRPLTKEQFEQFERMEFRNLTDAMLGRRKDIKCSTCQDDFKDEDVVVMLPCSGKHYYHELCIGEWLTKWSTVCPLCRTDVSPNS